MRSSDSLAGAGGQQLDVISVVMVSPGVLESREPDRTPPIAPASAAPVDTSESAPTPQQRQAPKPDPQHSPPEQTRTADAILEMKPEPIKHPEEQSNSGEASVAARGDAAVAENVSASVAASAGAVREYARRVAQALRKKKPKGIDARGTVKIRFIVTETGRPISVEIVKSSGDRRLDRKALDAVREAIFPPPPDGMTVTQLTYEVPYQFR
jgi:protein TonB